jgi:hypothetical protein
MFYHGRILISSGTVFGGKVSGRKKEAFLSLKPKNMKNRLKPSGQKEREFSK